MKSRTLRVLYVLASLGLIGVLGLVYALLCSFVYLAPTLPTAEQMRRGELQEPLRVYSRSGQLISQIGEQRRVPLTYDEIPEKVRDAFISAEDDRFFHHHGIDFMGVMRALFVNATSGRVRQGASTITMQAARNMFLTQERSARRKLQEIFVTLKMESEFGKKEILATYLNVIFFGQRAYGVAAASEVYFGKPVAELSLGEVATLAGLPQAPNDYSPATHPQKAMERRTYVLRRMVELHYIDKAEADQAAAEPIIPHQFALLNDVDAMYVAEMARQAVVDRFGEGALSSGYRVITTIDSRLQSKATQAVRIGLIEYDRRHGYRGPIARRKLPADASNEALEKLLSDQSTVGDLDPAVVVSLGPTSARVYVRTEGYAQIDWDGMSWARPGKPNTAGLLARGDIIEVVSDGHGHAQLAQRPEAQGALVALDPNDGAVVALVGGFDYTAYKFNRATQARRQPGSGFKPFLYSAALDHGITAADVVLDAPMMADDRGAEREWRPENSSHDFSGPMRVRDALVRSRNLVSIRLLRSVGVDDVIDYAKRFGFDPADMPHEQSLALGTLPARPIQIAAGYAVFANGGFRVEPYFIDRIEDGTGKVVFQAKPRVVCEICEDDAVLTPPAGSTTPRLHGLEPLEQRAERVASAANMWIMDDIMADVIKRGTGRRALVLGRNDIAGKTGTSQDNRDTWFNGFNRDLVASVWVGFDQEHSLGGNEEGASTALPIWINFMREALRGVPERPRPQPPGLVTATVNPATGLAVPAGTPGAVTEYFLADHLPPTTGAASNASSPNAPATDQSSIF